MNHTFRFLACLIAGILPFVVQASPQSPPPLAFPDPDGTLAVPLEFLSGYTFTGSESLPLDVAALEGKRVSFTGFIVPQGARKELDSFFLVKELWGCCFGKKPSPVETVKITLPKGSSLTYRSTPIIVTGTFHIQLQKTKEAVSGLYEMQAVSWKWRTY